MKKKYVLSKSLIPIANGTWGTPKDLERFGIAQEDVIKLRTIMEGIFKEKRLTESPDLNYFLALAGHFETYYTYDKGRIERKIIFLPVGSPCSSSPHKKALPLRGLFHEYSDELKDLARSLIEFLYEYDFIERLRKCRNCNKFFSRNRNDERNRFCSDDCRNLYNRDQRKTDEGKAKRAEYMKRHRALLSERKKKKEQADKLKRLMNDGSSRKEAEKHLNDKDA